MRSHLSLKTLLFVKWDASSRWSSSVLPHTESGRNDYREDKARFNGPYLSKRAVALELHAFWTFSDTNDLFDIGYMI